MTNQDYKKYKEAIIQEYEKYLVLRNNDNKSPEDLQNLKELVENIQKNEFTIAVAGEAKAGKSTFINAMLGAEILPTGVLQATSAIIKIEKSEKPGLKVTYADGKEMVKEIEADKILEELNKIAAVSDNFRDIPHTLLQEYIKKDKKSLTEDEFEDLTKKSGKSYTTEQKEKMQAYLKNTNLSDIPESIIIEYPLPWDFDHVKLIDTPGVNAMGGIKDITEEFIDTADAILFILHPQNIDSQSFADFVKPFTEKNKKNTYIILTHASDKTSEDRAALLNQAQRNYPNTEVFMLDSIYQSIYWDLKNGKSDEEIELLSEVKEDRLHKLMRLSQRDDKMLTEIAQREANYEPLYEALRKLSQEGPLMQLRMLLDKMNIGYENILKALKKEQMDLQALLDPLQELSVFVEKKKKELDDVTLSKNMKLREFQQKYESGDYNTEIEKRLRNCINDCVLKIENLSRDKDILSMIKKHIGDCSDGLQAIYKDEQDKLVKFFDENFNSVAPEYSMPTFDFESINQTARKRAEYEEPIMGKKKHRQFKRPWYFLWLVKEKHVWEEDIIEGYKTQVDKEKYYTLLIGETLSELIAVNIPQKIKDVFFETAENMRKEFETRSKENEERYKKELEELEQKKIDNETTSQEIKKLDANISEINSICVHIKKIKTNLTH